MSQLNVSNLAGIGTTLNQVSVSTGHSLEIQGTLKFNHTGAHRVPTGTTAERPTTSSAKLGQIRFNTTTGSFELYANSQWVSIGTAGAAGNTAGNYATPARNGREIKQAGRPLVIIGYNQ